MEFAKYQIMAKRYELLDITKPIAQVVQGGGASSTVGNSVSIVNYAPDGSSLLILHKFLDRLTPLRIELIVNSDYFTRGWIPGPI